MESFFIYINKVKAMVLFPITYLLLPVLLLTSCSDFLEIEPLTEITLENFWNEKSDVQNVVTGCYTSLQGSDCVSRMMAWGELRSDNIIGGTNVTNNTDLTNIFKENINSSNSFTSWECFYNVINTCNTVLHYAPEVAQKDPSFGASDLKATEAEVIALRSLCYFYLIRAFRDVPYTTEAYIDNTQEMQLPATPFATVLDSLINDLETVRPYAVKTYPVNKTGYQTAFITQDAISSMLCDMYLWKQDYQNAVKYADIVIDDLTSSYQKTLNGISGTVSPTNQMIDGYPLITDKNGSTYGNAYEAIFGEGGSRETIFELTYSSDETMPSNDAVSGYYGNSSTFPGIIKPAEFISQDMTLETPAVYLDKYDARYYECIQAVGTSDYGINKYVSSTVSVVPNTTSASAHYGTRCTSGLCKNNWIVYRLSDVMLMKAEALTQMVDENATSQEAIAHNTELLTEAYNIVNTINKRSSMATIWEDINYDTYSSKTQMTNLVMDERERELMFEGKRWFDLVRRALRDGNSNYLLSKVTRKGSDNASVVNSKLSREDALFWPYNKTELQVNNKLTQNPAYATGSDSNGYEVTTN